MAAQKFTDDELIGAFQELKSPTLIAKKFNCDVRQIYHRRRNIEAKLGVEIKSGSIRSTIHEQLDNHPSVKQLEIKDGVVLIGSDAHYWPNIITTAHRGFVHFCDWLKPKVVIMNGDVCDFATISRFPPIGWESRPTVIQEIEICQDRMEEIVQAAPKGAAFIWTLGNHDGRMETKLASCAPEFAKVSGVHLKDHFPRWSPAWMATINNDVVVKHRFKGGIHAPHNNVIQSGKSMVTGHLHSAKVTPWSDYNGTRYGVDCGSLAEPYGPQFQDYTELNPVNWRSAFCVLTFVDGILLAPELAMKWDENHVQFRGKLIKV